jgi:hypothetical protein
MLQMISRTRGKGRNLKCITLQTYPLYMNSLTTKARNRIMWVTVITKRLRKMIVGDMAREIWCVRLGSCHGTHSDEGQRRKTIAENERLLSMLGLGNNSGRSLDEVRPKSGAMNYLQATEVDPQ